MQYAKGTLGRVFLLKFDNGDIFIKELDSFARKENIKAATIVFLGALRKGHIVTGPKKPVIPPEPNWRVFKDGWEVMGMGTIFQGRSSPQIHIHASMGKRNKTITGCVRKESSVFLVIEAVVFEIKGVRAAKELDPKTGINLLRLG